MSTNGYGARIKQLARDALWRGGRTVFDAAIGHWRGQVFSIGMYRGATLHSLDEASGANNPVLRADDVTDVPAAFVADPFLLRHDGVWFMFFEVLNRVSRMGQIAVATSRDGLRWQYGQTVLKEPFHLAYPHVFAWGDRIFMVPDTPGNGVRLYESVEFPNVWKLSAVLFEKNTFSDSSVFQFEDRWWMFAGWVRRRGDPMSLRLFGAADPTGPWWEHPQSPVIRGDDRVARPAGRVQILEGVAHRFTQNCRGGYGLDVKSIEITELSPTRYSERVEGRDVLRAGRAPWNAGGMHHLDAVRAPDGAWLACVDGWRYA